MRFPGESDKGKDFHSHHFPSAEASVCPCHTTSGRGESLREGEEWALTHPGVQTAPGLAAAGEIYLILFSIPGFKPKIP